MSKFRPPDPRGQAAAGTIAVPSRNGRPQRFTPSSPCPVCGGYDRMKRGQGTRCFGFLSEDGEWCHCTREDLKGQAKHSPSSQTYAHKVTGECPCGREHAPAPVGERFGSGFPEIAATYDYRDADGTLVFQVVRTRNPKSFFQRRPKPGGGWIKNVKGVTLLPYRLPELRAANPAYPVYIVEGEKDADRLLSEGLSATTNPTGAGKWNDEYSPELKGRHVVIMPDNDPPGRDHAAAVARSVHPVAASVKVIELPGLPDHGDVSDWLNSGGTIEALGHIVYKAPQWSPVPPPTARPIAGPGSPSRFPLTDLGNGERLAAMHGNDLRFCHPWNKWLVWDGKRWALDQTAAVRRMAKVAVRAIYSEAADQSDDQERLATARWAKASESRQRIEAMIYEAAKEPGVPVLPDDMDRNRWLLNVQNGTIDLRTGELRPHRRDNLISFVAPVEYHPNVACPLWDSSLDLIFDGRADLIGFWQRLYGCCLTGDVTEQFLPIAYGKGENGKSTVLNVLLGLLGPDYAMKAPPSFLMVKRNESHPTELADLFRKRVVIASETGDGARINETLVKELTGSDVIRSRRMREDFWQFEPTHKIIVATNHRPTVRGTDHAIWRRLRLVPFDVQIPAERKDRNMPAKLAKEYPGILAWCVRGCLDWQRDGLNPPAEVLDATAEYRAEQDTLGAFLDEMCLQSPSLRCKSSQLYARYQEWTEHSGESAVSLTRFGNSLKERGIEKIRNNGTFYLGIGLRDDNPPIQNIEGF